MFLKLEEKMFLLGMRLVLKYFCLSYCLFYITQELERLKAVSDLARDLAQRQALAVKAENVCC